MKKKREVDLPGDYQGKREEWIQKKTQEFIALRGALETFEYGSAYLPEGCGNALYLIRRYVNWMDESIKQWV